MPQPMAATHRARARGRDRAAEISPPTTAPAPMTEAIRPYAAAPWWKTLVAISGSVTWNSQASVPTTAMRSSGMSSSGVCLT